MRYTDWDDFLRAEFRDHPKKLITSILVDRLPRRLVEALIEEYFSSIREVFVGSISRQDRENISALLGRGIPITLTERRAGDEFVTAGGVVTDEIDPETMESHIQKHLYFAGEILDVDGYTGGFSLQICWSSGYTAGRAIIEHIKNK
jgi:predicted flavoprotein YhiN